MIVIVNEKERWTAFMWNAKKWPGLAKKKNNNNNTERKFCHTE